MEIYSNMEGMEDNHIIDRFGFMFPVGRIHKLKEIEMQGLLYMYHRYCCEDCSGCPVLSGLGSGIPIY